MGTDKIACSPIKIVLFCVYLLDYGSFHLAVYIPHKYRVIYQVFSAAPHGLKFALLHPTADSILRYTRLCRKLLYCANMRFLPLFCVLFGCCYAHLLSNSVSVHFFAPFLFVCSLFVCSAVLPGSAAMPKISTTAAKVKSRSYMLIATVSIRKSMYILSIAARHLFAHLAHHFVKLLCFV